MDFNQELDTRGMMCPLPIIKTKLAMDKLRQGEVLRVRATDAGSVRDMEAFATTTRNPLLSSEAEDGEFVYFLQKGPATGR